MVLELAVFWTAFGARVSTAPSLPTEKTIVRRYIREELPQIERCYLNEASGQPHLAGTATAYFTIGPDGQVLNILVDGMAPPLSDCIATVIRGIRFPAPADGGRVNVTYPFTFL